MSESQSKKSSNDVITAFRSSVSRRTRSRWDEYIKSVAESRGISSNMAAPSSGSVGISAPRKRKTGGSSSCSGRKMMRGTQTKPKQGAAGSSSRNGNESDDYSDSDEFVIERAELYNSGKRGKSKLGASAATSRKAVEAAAHGYSSPEDVTHGSTNPGVSFGKGKKTDGVNRRTAPNTCKFGGGAAVSTYQGPFIQTMPGLILIKCRGTSRVQLRKEASEMAIDDSGYIAPEHNQPGNGNIQVDMYAFGVLLLELLTLEAHMRAISGEMGFIEASRQLVFGKDSRSSHCKDHLLQASLLFC